MMRRTNNKNVLSNNVGKAEKELAFFDDQDEKIEAQIARGFITDPGVIQEMLNQPEHIDQYFESTAIKELVRLCFSYYKAYNKAPGSNIHDFLLQKLQNGEINETNAMIIEKFTLGYLSDEHKEYGNNPFLIDRTLDFLNKRKVEKLHEQQEILIKKNDYKGVIKLQTLFRPLTKSDDDKNTLQAGDGFVGDIEPTKFIVENLLPVGLTVLAGKSNTMKSFFIQTLALKLAQNKPIFGDEHEKGFKGEPGEILYLYLENGGSRQCRYRQRLIEKEPRIKTLNHRLTYKFSWPKLNAGGFQLLEQWLKEQKEPKLIIIDTLPKIWGKSKKTSGTGIYTEDYDIYGPLSDLANKYEVGIVAVQHTKKSREDDVFDEILGGSGVQGASDALMVLQRHLTEEDARILSIRGNNIAGNDRRMKFYVDAIEHVKVDMKYTQDEHQPESTPQRQIIVNFLRDHGPLKFGELKTAAQKGSLQVSVNSINTILRKMLSEDRIYQDQEYGSYFVPEKK